MLKYNYGQGFYQNWILEEHTFQSDFLGKCETLMTTGNGYFCSRGATEERYLNETRNTFVAGTYNKFDDSEVCELPNIADYIATEIMINGEKLNLDRGIVSDYSRTLNLKDGILTRTFLWFTPKTGTVKFQFERIHSMHDIHSMGMTIQITPLDRDISVTLLSGIDGQMTNSGVQHFSEGSKRLYDNKIMQAVFSTTESNIDFVLNCFHQFSLDHTNFTPDQLILMDRRQIRMKYSFDIGKSSTMKIEKIGNVYTSRDRTWSNDGLETLKEFSKSKLTCYEENGFTKLFQDHKSAMQEIWDKNDVKIDSENDFDQLAIRFSIYHLFIMTPAHDNRMNIGAKGMTGEGYKGHVFWDTEIFMLPFFIYQNPEIARSLLEYRYLGLDGARKKAKDNGCEGAMYPWESAWTTGGEVTPLWGAADIITGKSTKIWSGIKEIHITCDVAFAVWQYYNITNDQDYMDRYGYEILFDTAKFWNSRLESKNGRYEICDVVGPDEYKEHIDNNAFTNYMAYWNIALAIQLYGDLKENNPLLFVELNKKLELDRIYKNWNTKLDQIYLPERNNDLIIPQNDTFLSLREMDLTKYKEAKSVGTMFLEYSLDQVNQIMVSKQSDTLLIFYLLDDLFDRETKIANFNFYEKHTLHDSSLSYSTHCVLANDIGHKELAYSFFDKAASIDLGDNPTSSDHGIHAAAQGGLWQCVVNGFAGVRLTGKDLRILPSLPDSWNEIEFRICWHGNPLEVKVDKEFLTIYNLGSTDISFHSYNGENLVDSQKEISIKYN